MTLTSDDLNPESWRDPAFFNETDYSYQKEFLSEMLANSLEAGRALGGEYFSGPTSRGMGQEEQIAKGADLWLQAQDFLGYDDLITLLQSVDAQAGIDWAWSLQREPTYQKDIASIASYLNPFNTAFEQVGGAALKFINPWGGGVEDQASAAFDQLMSADDRLLDYGQNPYGSRFKRITGIEDWGDALWFAFDLFDIATLGTGGAVLSPARRKLAEIMIRTDRWDNALGKKILGDDIYNDLLNRMPAERRAFELPVEEPRIVPQEDDAFDIDFDIDEAVEAHYDWSEPGNSAARLDQANDISRGSPDTSDFSSYQEYQIARQDWEWPQTIPRVDEPSYEVSYDAHRSPAPKEPDFPTGIERLEGETFWGGMTRHMFNVDAEQSVMKESISEAPLVKRPSNVTPTADEAHAFIETYMPPEIMVKVFPFGASDDEAVKFGTILYDYLYDVDFNLGRVKGKGFGSNLHSYPPFLTPNSQATDLYIRSQDTYGATLFDEQGVEGASAIKDAIKVTRNGEPLEFSDVLELASDMDYETAEFWQVIDDIFFSGETSANALNSPEGFNQWWDAVQEAKMKIELEYPDLGVTIPEEILNTSHERAMNAIAFEAQLGEHVFGDIFVKNGKFYRATPREIEDRLYRSDAALTRGPLDEGAGDILDSVFPPEQSLGEEATEKALEDDLRLSLDNIVEIDPENITLAGPENIDLPGSWRSDRPDIELTRRNERLSIAIDDFDGLMSMNLTSQANMDLEGFLEVIYRLREGTELHAERLSWLDSIESRDWRGVPFEFVEDEAYGAVRDFVESSVRAFSIDVNSSALHPFESTRDIWYRRIGEVTPENELTQLHRLHVAVKKEEEKLLRWIDNVINTAWWSRTSLGDPIDVSLKNLGIPEKTRETINTLICLLYTSPSPRDATLSRMPS